MAILRHGKSLLMSMFLAASCSSPADKTATNSTPLEARRELLAILTAQAQQSTYPFRVQDSLVVFTVDSSPAIERARYYTASYRPVEVPDAQVWAVLFAVEGSHPVRITNLADWIRAIGKWRPKSQRDVERICLEMLNIEQERWQSLRAVYLDDLDNSRKDLLPTDTSQLRHLSAVHELTSPTSKDERWRLRAWVVAPGLRRIATRVQCEVPATTNELFGRSPVVVEDSLLRR